MSRLINCKSFRVSTTGDNTLITPRGPNNMLHIFSVLFNPSADITGEVTLKLGSTIIAGAQGPKTGALYGFNNNPNFVSGKAGESLKINLPTGTATTVDVTWREAPDYNS